MSLEIDHLLAVKKAIEDCRTALLESVGGLDEARDIEGAADLSADYDNSANLMQNDAERVYYAMSLCCNVIDDCISDTLGRRYDP